MTDQSSDARIESWLAALASGSAAPGGGAVAALVAAAAAGLVAMTCRVTIGRPAFAAREKILTDVLARADELRTSAAGLMEADSSAYGRVIDALKLPRSTEAERSLRQSAIDEALLGAAQVPLETAKIACRVIRLAATIGSGANPNAHADLDAAVVSAQAAFDISIVNIRTNLSAMSEPGLGRELIDELSDLVTVSAEARSFLDSRQNSES
jgi:formiminotetrahydrofolate cyclodeaminase